MELVDHRLPASSRGQSADSLRAKDGKPAVHEGELRGEPSYDGFLLDDQLDKRLVGKRVEVGQRLDGAYVHVHVEVHGTPPVRPTHMDDRSDIGTNPPFL